MRLAAVGDVIPVRGVSPSRGDAREALSRLGRADLALATLEAPLTDRGEPWDKTVMYRAAPERAADVAAMGFDIVSLANNQAMNYGRPGLAQTLEVLAEHGISTVGAGRNAKEAWQPWRTRVAGMEIAVVAFTCVAPPGWAATDQESGLAVVDVTCEYEADERWQREEPGAGVVVHTTVNQASLAVALGAVTEASDEADTVVVSVHWGAGDRATPLDYQAQLGRALVDAGAALVVGSHPPPLQGFAAYPRGFVAYSLGTFVRQQPQETADPRLNRLYRAMPRTAALLEAELRPGGAPDVTLTPLRLDDNGVADVARGDAFAAIAADMRRRIEGSDLCSIDAAGLHCPAHPRSS